MTFDTDLSTYAVYHCTLHFRRFNFKSAKITALHPQHATKRTRKFIEQTKYYLRNSIWAKSS